MYLWFILPILVLFLYIGAPTLYFRWLRFRARMHPLRLTFDDGPGERMTATILDMLDQNGTKAMFFVKGNAVAGRESVVQQIIVRGHDIGCHGYAHLDYWRCGPLASLADVRNGYEAVDRALGVTGGRYPFRPPNGRLNLVVLFYLLFVRRVKIVPWTGDIGDRRPERYRDIEGVVTVIRRRSRGIILAHDSDSRLPGLEAYTQNAVKAILGAIT